MVCKVTQHTTCECVLHQEFQKVILTHTHSSCAKMSASNREEGETPGLFTPTESTTSSKHSVLRKKLQAETSALELKIAKQAFTNEIECLCAKQQKCAKLLELQKN